MGHDIDNMDTPVEVGLGFAVKLDKPGKFIGYDVLAKQKEYGVQHRRLLQVLVEDPEAQLFHAEPIFRNGESVGYVRVGGYGHHLGGAVGLAIVEIDEKVNKAYIEAGTWTVQIDGKLEAMKVSAAPMYDPKLERVKE